MADEGDPMKEQPKDPREALDARGQLQVVQVLAHALGYLDLEQRLRGVEAAADGCASFSAERWRDLAESEARRLVGVYRSALGEAARGAERERVADGLGGLVEGRAHHHRPARRPPTPPGPSEHLARCLEIAELAVRGLASMRPGQ